MSKWCVKCEIGERKGEQNGKQIYQSIAFDVLSSFQLTPSILDCVLDQMFIMKGFVLYHNFVNCLHVQHRWMEVYKIRIVYKKFLISRQWSIHLLYKCFVPFSETQTTAAYSKLHTYRYLVVVERDTHRCAKYSCVPKNNDDNALLLSSSCLGA